MLCFADGTYLRLLRGRFDEGDVLGVTEDDLQARFCPECDLGRVCQQEDSVGKMSPLCPDGVATRVLKAHP